MSLLTMVQRVCGRRGLPVPTAVYSSVDPIIVQMLALANEEAQDLANRYPWQALQTESTFTTVATESQGAITTLAGAGFKYVLNDTMWNRDLRRPVFGPLVPYQWQQLKAQQITGPWNQFRIRNGNVLFIPAPAAGQTIALEWVTKYWMGGTSDVWTADTDTAYLDEDIMALGLMWRWNQMKGLEYAEDQEKYEKRVADAMARDAGKPVLNMNGGNIGYPAGVFVPNGGWVGH